MSENVKRELEFRQVCVWEGKVVGPDGVAAFEDYMMQEFGIRAKYLEEIKTAPRLDKYYGGPISETGGRNDLFFAVHDDDTIPFAYPRASAGIRWIEAVLPEIKSGKRIYPERVFDYRNCSNDTCYEDDVDEDGFEYDEACWDDDAE